MKTLKHLPLSLALVLFLAVPLFAADSPGSTPKAGIEGKKAEILAKIDKRIQQLQAAKACVTAAATKEDLKKCKP